MDIQSSYPAQKEIKSAMIALRLAPSLKEAAEKAAAEDSRADEAERQMDGQRALELLGALDETYRAPLTLFYLQQHSYRDDGVAISTLVARWRACATVM